MTPNHSAPTDTILFIHGLWMTPRSWEKWMERYESRGYRVLAPAWPGLEGEVEALNADPTPLTRLSVAKIVDHYDTIIRGLDSPPIRNGAQPGLSREESDAIYQRYHVPAANRVLAEVASATLTRNEAVTVDFAKDRPPMLSIAFEHDHTVPPKVARHNVEKYSKSPAVTEFKEYAGRPHFPGAPGWEEVADYALTWAIEHAGARREPIATA
jgi:pimeloyl-ACP methyl ester carboxylesterase